MYKTINFGDGRFIINEEGDIINTVTGNHISAPVFNNGYRTVTLNYNGISKKFLLHRLIAEYFIPNPENKPVVLHIDNDKLNLKLSNMKWGTYSENNAQAIRDGLNKVPRPDNRKMYIISKDDAPVYIECNGINKVIEKLGYGNDSCIRNYIFRKTPITQGSFKGWNVSKK